MTLIPGQPSQDLTIERVRSGRRAALVVLVGAIVVVGTLIWKPWDVASGTPGASPSTSPGPVVALATPVPSPSAGAPSPVEQPPPTSRPAVDKTPPPIGTITWYKRQGDPVVTCVYDSGAQGRRTLTAMVVTGPSISASADKSANPLRSVQWQAQIEVNDLQSVFSADWRTVAASAPARYVMRPHDQFTAKPVTVEVSPDSAHRSAVFRAVAAVNWFGPEDVRLHDERTAITSYGPPQGATEGCPAFVARKK